MKTNFRKNLSIVLIATFMISNMSVGGNALGFSSPAIKANSVKYNVKAVYTSVKRVKLKTVDENIAIKKSSGNKANVDYDLGLSFEEIFAR